MKHIYISSCDKTGGIYHYILKNGKLEFSDKTPLDRPMYTVIYNNKLYVILRETDENTHFGGVMSFDIANDGKLKNPSKTVSTNGICPCHLAVAQNDVYVVNYLSGNITSISRKIDTHNGKGENLPRQDMAHTHYSASKAAQTNMVKSLSLQLAKDGITVNNIAPGVIYTDRNYKVLSDPVYAQKVKDSIPVGYYGEAEDCSGMVSLLCSDEGRYITGQSIYIDGGKSVQ